jgi:hypothetical protein
MKLLRVDVGLLEMIGSGASVEFPFEISGLGCDQLGKAEWQREIEEAAIKDPDLRTTVLI